MSSQLRIELGYSITNIPCIKNECDEKHTENFLKSIMINEKLSRGIHREDIIHNGGNQHA